MEDNQSEDDVTNVSVNQRKKKVVKHIIDLKLPAEQKFTMFTVPLSDGG